MKISKEIKIGITVVVSFFALFFGINYLKGFNLFVPSNSFYAQYKAIDGLEKSAPVLIEGYKVGQINDIYYDFSKETPFTVQVSLNSDLKIPRGSQLELFSNGLLGGKCIRIVLNKHSQGYHRAGDTIPSSVGGSLMDEFERDIMPSVKNVVPQIDSLLFAARLIAENQSINNTLKSLEMSSRNLEQSSAELKKMMQTEIPDIINNVKILTANLASTTQTLDNANIEGTLQKIDNTMQNISDITAKIDNNTGSLGLLINDKALYNNLTNTTDNANQLVIDLKENPKRYVHFSVFGKSDKKTGK